MCAHRKICVHVYTCRKKENAEYVASGEQVPTWPFLLFSFNQESIRCSSTFC